LGRLVEFGFITSDEQKILQEIYNYNPLLFEFAVKRTIRWKDKKFSDSIFMENSLL
jgi:hypothetical protein